MSMAALPPLIVQNRKVKCENRCNADDLRFAHPHRIAGVQKEPDMGVRRTTQQRVRVRMGQRVSQSCSHPKKNTETETKPHHSPLDQPVGKHTPCVKQ